jgi:hypothetical protein
MESSPLDEGDWISVNACVDCGDGKTCPACRAIPFAQRVNRPFAKGRRKVKKASDASKRDPTTILNDLGEELLKHGFEADGAESMYCGFTGPTY